MKHNVMVFMVALTLSALPGRAAFQATIAFANGAIRELDRIDVQQGALLLPADEIRVPISTIQSVDVSFDNLSPARCERLLNEARFEELRTVLEPELAPLEPVAGAPGNLGGFVRWLMKAAYWTGKTDLARRQIALLKESGSPFASEAELYDVMILIDEGRSGDAAIKLAETGAPESVSPAMTEVIRARLMMEQKNWPQALQHVANVAAFYSRDPEWMPAAAFYEGSIYKRTGYLQAASNIVAELEMTYPEGWWSRRAAELK